MLTPMAALAAARVLAIEAETGRKVVAIHSKRDFAAMVTYLTVWLNQRPASAKVRVFKAIWERCKGLRGIDVPIATGDLAAECGIVKADRIRQAAVWLEQHGLIYRNVQRGQHTRYAITLPPEAAAAAA
jgi:hypothetical protein